MRYFLILWFLGFSLVGYSSGIRISEISAAGTAGVTSKSGDHPDWLELENTSDDTIALSGYYLSDQADDLTEFRFKHYQLLPGAFVVVHASAKYIPSNTDLHADFNIDSQGETIYLSDSTGTIVDQGTAPPMAFNQSAGINSAGIWSVFDLPTPNAPNSSTNMTVSYASGFYADQISVTLLTDNDAPVFYTLDGSEPTESSLRYTNPINLQSGQEAVLSYVPTTVMQRTDEWNWEPYFWKSPVEVPQTAAVLKCRAFRDGVALTKTYTRTFFLGQNFEQFSEFPIVALTMDADDIIGNEAGIYVPGNKFDVEKWKKFWPLGNYDLDVEKDVAFEYFDTDGNCQIKEPGLMKITGVSSRTLAQKGFKISFSKDRGAENVTYPVFGSSSQDEYNELGFRNSGNDFLWTHFADAFMQSLLTDTGLETSNSAPCNVFINGEYWGIFNIRERYSKQFFYNKFGVDEKDLTVIANNNRVVYGTSSKEYRDILSYAKDNDPESGAFYQFFDSLIDIDNFIDYNICQIYFANSDWPGNNYKVWKSDKESSKWRYLLFDLDYSMGLMNLAHVEKNSLERLMTIDTVDVHAEERETRTIRTLLQNPTFRDQFIDRFIYHLEHTFDPDRVIGILDSYEQLYENQIQYQIDRWGYPSDIDTWYKNVDKMRSFARYRPCVLNDYIGEAFGLETATYTCRYNGVTTEEINLAVYPNPARSIIFVDCEQELQTVSVQTMTGVQVFCETIITEKGVEITVDHLPTGLYCVLVIFDGEYVSKNIAVVH